MPLPHPKLVRAAARYLVGGFFPGTVAFENVIFVPRTAGTVAFENVNFFPENGRYGCFRECEFFSRERPVRYLSGNPLRAVFLSQTWSLYCINTINNPG
jgi:hypothetical protein